MLIIVDLFSKFVEIVAMRDQTAESMRSGLEMGGCICMGYQIPF